MEEFESVREKATEEYNKFEEEKQNYPLVDTTPKTDDIHGLSPKENSELRGVTTPNESVDPTTRHRFLKIQADHFQETIDKTREINGENSLEGFELNERVTGLEKARDRTLEQLEIEKVRENQEEDISRFRRLKEWVKKNKLAVGSLVINVASLITMTLVLARGAVVKGAGAVKSLADSVYSTFKDAAKKLGPLFGPVALAIGTLLFVFLKYGAKGIAWLANNLWIIVIAIVLLVYYRYRKKK